MNIFKSLKKVSDNATGIKSSALAHSYTLATFVILANLICFYLLMFIGGAIKDFIVYGDMLKDFAVPITTATITFCSIAVTTCLGATYLDSKQPQQETGG